MKNEKSKINTKKLSKDPVTSYVLKDDYTVKGKLAKKGSKVELTVIQADYLKSINKI